MNKIKVRWNRILSWFIALWAMLTELGKEVPEKAVQVPDAPPEFVRDTSLINDAAKAYLAKRPKFKIGDIVEWIPECRLKEYPNVGENAVVVGFDIPKIAKEISPIETNRSLQTTDIKLMVQNNKGSNLVFLYESWRFRKVGTIFAESEKKKSAKKSAPKKKTAPKKKAKRRNAIPQGPRGLEAIQAYPTNTSESEKPKRRNRKKTEEQVTPSTEAA